MSLLQTPRLAFRGKITWDPIVTNNYKKFYDENDCESELRPQETAKQFRQTAINAVSSSGGNWNPHGTHRSVFFETQVRSVDLGAGPTTDDSFVGQPVSFSGMLVDLEPYGSTSSQLFFDKMQFGIDGGSRVLAPRRWRMVGRRIYFGRNQGRVYIAGGASVTWQTAFPKGEGLVIDPHDSPLLTAFARALEDDDVLGLSVRWNAYRTIYFDDPALHNGGKNNEPPYTELKKKLLEGGWQPNPARSELVGVLGLWRRNEPRAVGGDRFLASSAKGDPVGSAYARVDNDRVTLDLQNSIPEINLELEKQKLGELTLLARDPAGQAADLELATLSYDQYDREAYDLAGGLVTVPVDPANAFLAAERDLVLTAGGAQVLTEVSHYGCADTPNSYIHEGESGHVAVRVLERGGVPKAPVTLRVSDGSAVSSYTTDSSGVAQVPIQGSTGGIQQFLMVAGDAKLPNSLDPVRDPYLLVRTLPADDNIASLPPTWENVYERVLIDWHAMAPCMDNWLRLEDPAQIRAYAGLVRRLTSLDEFESYLYMPVTRDLTPGKRALLYRWLKSGDLESVAVQSPVATKRAARHDGSRLG